MKGSNEISPPYKIAFTLNYLNIAKFERVCECVCWGGFGKVSELSVCHWNVCRQVCPITLQHCLQYDYGYYRDLATVHTHSFRQFIIRYTQTKIMQSIRVKSILFIQPDVINHTFASKGFAIWRRDLSVSLPELSSMFSPIKGFLGSFSFYESRVWE